MSSLFKPQSAPIGLVERIIARIRHEHDLRILRIRIGLFAICGIASIIALVPALNDLMHAKAVGELMNYISYLGTEPGIIVAYWQDLVSTITESLPILSLTYVLGLVVVFLWSADAFLHDTTSFFRVSKIAK